MHQPVRLGAAQISFVGFPEQRVHRLISAAKEIRIDATPLRRLTVENADVLPLTPRPDGRFHGGVRDASGASVSFSETHRHDLGSVVDVPSLAESAPITYTYPRRRALFGGVLFGGYGHILLESLNRLWCAAEEPDIDILFLGVRGAAEGRNWLLLKEFATLLGVGADRLVLVSEPIRAPELVVPEPGLELGLRTSLQHWEFIKKALGRHVVPERAPVGTAYVSRSRLKGLVRKPLGEPAIEKAVLSSGGVVYWPETDLLSEQVKAFNRHSAYAGFLGSHLHNLFLRFVEAPVDCAYLCSEAPNLNFIQVDMLLPGRRIYRVASRFDPVYEFGNRAPYRIDTVAAAEALSSVGLPIDSTEVAPIEDSAYVEHWAYLMFHHKVLRPLDLRVRSGQIEDAEDAVRTAITGLVAKLDRSPTDTAALGDSLLRAYAQAVRHVGIDARPMAAAGADLLKDLLGASALEPVGKRGDPGLS